MAHSTSETAFLTLEKSFTYRGEREHWINTYHLDQVPSSQANWDGLALSAWLLEAPFLTADVHFEWVYGHEPGTPPVLVYEKDQPPAGEGGAGGSFVPGTNDHPAPGDAAMWVRWGTTQKNTLGKPIYLRNYYHGVWTAATADDVAIGQLNSLNALGTAWTNGVTGGTQSFRRAGPRGAVAQNHAAGAFITTRTLKARGKRHRWTPGAAPSGYRWILTNVPQEIN